VKMVIVLHVLTTTKPELFIFQKPRKYILPQTTYLYKMKPIPASIYHQAVAFLKQGQSCWDISKKLHISVTTVQNIRKKSDGFLPAPRVGRPYKISRRTRRSLARKFDLGEL